MQEVKNSVDVYNSVSPDMAGSEVYLFLRKNRQPYKTFFNEGQPKHISVECADGRRVLVFINDEGFVVRVKVKENGFLIHQKGVL